MKKGTKIETTLNTSSQIATDNKLLQNLTLETTYDIYAEICDYAEETATSEKIQVTTGPGVALHVEIGKFNFSGENINYTSNDTGAAVMNTGTMTMTGGNINSSAYGLYQEIQLVILLLQMEI